MTPPRQNVMVAASTNEATTCKSHFPQYRNHLVLTPRRTLTGILVGEYVWTPGASALPAAVRLRLRGELAPMIDGDSREEEFPLTLLSW